MIRPIASARVAASRSWPRTALVMVFEPGLRTPAHGHAQVLTFDHHDHPARLQDAVDGLGDLGGQSLLHLGALRVEINKTSQLAEPGDLAVAVRYIADVGDPGERHEMVFAAAPHFDVLDQDQFVVADVEDGRQDLLGILPQPAEHFRVRPRYPLWGITQAVPIGILPDSDQDLAYRSDDTVMIELSDALGEVNRVDPQLLPARIRPGFPIRSQLSKSAASSSSVTESQGLCGGGSGSPAAGSCEGTGGMARGCWAPPAGT